MLVSRMKLVEEHQLEVSMCCDSSMWYVVFSAIGTYHQVLEHSQEYPQYPLVNDSKRLNVVLALRIFFLGMGYEL